MKVVNFLIVAACCRCVIAQQAVGETDIFYDSGRNVIYATASTTSDYNTQYYYTAWVNSTMFNGGSFVDWQQAQGAPIYVETPATPGYEVVVYSTHILNAEYQSYEVIPGCYYCYDWYDSYGYNLLGDGGNPSMGPTWTVWVWAAPIIITRTISQIVSDQQGGARMRAPGLPMTFDARLRSFIPPSFVQGPEPFCYPYTGKLVLYNGNKRSFDPWSVSYKGHQSVTLIPDYTTALLAVNDTGFTRKYAADALAPDGVTLREDQILHDCYWLDDAGQESNSGMAISSSSPGSGQEGANFSGAITNPLTPPCCTPAINWNVSVLVNKSNPSAPSYTIVGSHDCFPAWEAYIGRQLIYSFTPSSYNPANLAACLSGTFLPTPVNGSGQIQ